MRLALPAWRLAPATAPRWPVGWACIAVLAVVPALSAVLQQPFYMDVATRIVIFAIAAVSLDFVLGYGGLVSFCHASLLGVGAYAMGILAAYGVTSGPVQLLAAVGGSAAIGMGIAAVSLRTTGMQFIMITLGFGQMLYFLMLGLQAFGGDSGLTIVEPSDWGPHLDLSDPATLFYVALAVLAAVLFLLGRVVRSSFGVILQAGRINERRLLSLGVPVTLYRLAAFGISGGVCGLAGLLLANQSLFVSPALMHWSRSGELMVMVILGGQASLAGPVLGAAAFLLLEEVLPGWTDYWQATLGALLLAFVLFAPGGIIGLLGPRRAR